jgi:enoyl-CoA hydratase
MVVGDVNERKIMSERILIDHGGDGVSRITLHAPEKRNALDAASIVALTQAFQACDEEESTRVIIITGSPGAFCAGGDIGTFGSKADTRVRRRGARLVDSILATEKPIIARVNGAAVGLGLTIALLADITIASDNSKFGDTHVNLGAVAGDGVALILPLLIGPQRAKELLLTGRIIDAHEAARIGMIFNVVTVEELDGEVEKLATSLKRQPPYATRATKAAINQLIKTASRDVLDLALAYEEVSRSLPEHDEAVDAWRKSHAKANGVPAAPTS